MTRSQIVLVTGANTGIGFEVARALARQRFIVYLGGRDATKVDRAARELADAGEVRSIPIDLDAPATLEAAVQRIQSEHGLLDVLVNNAGASFSGTVLDATPEVIERSFQTNLHGPMHLARLAVPLLRKAGAGARIINVSSGAGQMAFIAGEKWPLPVEKLPYSYCIAKASLNAATVMLAAALKHDGIRVNACNPGYTRTRVSGFAGSKTPAEGAEIVIRLALGDDRGETGRFFDSDGSLLDW